MASTVNFTFSQAGMPGAYGAPVDVYDARFWKSENIVATGVSQSTVNAARARDNCRVTCTGDKVVYVGAPNTTAVLGVGWMVLPGQSLDLSNLREGDVLPVISAA